MHEMRNVGYVSTIFSGAHSQSLHKNCCQSSNISINVFHDDIFQLTISTCLI